MRRKSFSLHVFSIVNTFHGYKLKNHRHIYTSFASTVEPNIRIHETCDKIKNVTEKIPKAPFSCMYKQSLRENCIDAINRLHLTPLLLLLLLYFLMYVFRVHKLKPLTEYQKKA